MIAPKVKFLKDGKQVQIGEVAWFVGNLPQHVADSSNTLVIKYVDRPPHLKVQYITEYDESEK